MASDIKAPPSLSKSSSYESWLKAIKIWQTFTNIPQPKQGPAIFLTLEGKAAEAVLELDVEKINHEDGVKNIIAKLDTLYLRDRVQTAYQCYDQFEKFQRTPDMSISEFIIQFERLLTKTKSYGTNMSSDILAYRLLKSANVSEHHQQLARATVKELTYEEMKDQLKKIFGDKGALTSSSEGDVSSVKVESANDCEQDVLYGRYYEKPSYRGKSFRGGRGARGNAVSQATYRGTPSRGRRGRNPTDERGNVTKCSICESINHWAATCPDGQYFTETLDEACVDVDPDHKVTLFESNLITDKSMQVFVVESACAAILDSGATATVAGKQWMNMYKESLTPDQQKLIKYSSSSNTFKFGAGDVCGSLYKATVPATIGENQIFIETDVVENNIPMLLSKDSMKKAKTEINFEDDTVFMLGETQQVIVTSSGHYAVPLNKNINILNDVILNGAAVTLNLTHNPKDKMKTANKLHIQFSHPNVNKLLNLINKAGMGNDCELINCVKEVSRSCKVCKVFSRPRPVPAVGLPLATDFNEVVAMDIKFLNGKIILHLIDHLTRFSAAAVIPSKKPEVVISKIFQMWISVFGPPSKFFSDNGGEFNNSLFRELCEKYNITVKTTAAESPWSNGLCERHNAVLGEMVEKTMAEGVPVDVAVNWAVHAKNSLSNVHGFSPYQLAIGYTPKLPSVLCSKPPALESTEKGDTEVHSLIKDHLTAMGAARKAFVECENSEKIKRALRSNLRSSGNTKFITGDSVYYKRMDSKKWKGPGRVIGQDGQQVLIKHGGMYVRVHPCRVMFEKDDTVLSEKHASKQLLPTEGLPLDEPQNSDAVLCSSDEEGIDPPHVGDTDQMPFVNSSPARTSMHLRSGSEDSLVSVAPQQLTAGSVPLTGGDSETAGEDPHRRSVLKRDASIQYKVNDGEWVNGVVLRRAGKATGKYRSNWHVKDCINGTVKEVDFEDPSVTWRMAQPADNNEVLLCNVYLADNKEQIKKAKEVELENWSRESVYEEVPDEGQQTISVRWVITPKCVEGNWITKARLVARGFEESDHVRSDSPTCMKDSLRLIFTASASNGWQLNSIDIKAAFLQGNPIKRDLFLQPPKEANCVGKVWRLRKVVYGLTDASRVWYLRVLDEMAKLGATTSKYDKAVFIWRVDNRVEGIMACHVDDFLWTGTRNFEAKVITPLKNVFKVSTESMDCFKYVGIQVNKTEDFVEVGQSSYIDSLTLPDLDRIDVTDKSRELDEAEIKLFRGIVGQLNWASNISRPDVAYTACELSTQQAKPQVEDLLRASKAMKEMKQQNVIIRFRPLMNDRLKLLVFSDASYGNLRNGGSQGGFIVFLSDGSLSVPISWSSSRLKRVARSTLCAETLSAVEALDSAYLVEKLCCELFGKPNINVELYTDNRSLFDAIHTTNLMVDKRLRVDIASLREMFENEEVSFHWLDTKHQVADVLTKKGASKKNLIEVLAQSKILFD